MLCRLHWLFSTVYSLICPKVFFPTSNWLRLMGESTQCCSHLGSNPRPLGSRGNCAILGLLYKFIFLQWWGWGIFPSVIVSCFRRKPAAVVGVVRCSEKCWFLISSSTSQDFNQQLDRQNGSARVVTFRCFSAEKKLSQIIAAFVLNQWDCFGHFYSSRKEFCPMQSVDCFLNQVLMAGLTCPVHLMLEAFWPVLSWMAPDYLLSQQEAQNLSKHFF